MINFGIRDDLARVMDIGREAAELVTKTFIRPINLEFEKVWAFKIFFRVFYFYVYVSDWLTVCEWDWRNINITMFVFRFTSLTY